MSQRIRPKPRRVTNVKNRSAEASAESRASAALRWLCTRGQVDVRCVRVCAHAGKGGGSRTSSSRMGCSVSTKAQGTASTSCTNLGFAICTTAVLKHKNHDLFFLFLTHPGMPGILQAYLRQCVFFQKKSRGRDIRLAALYTRDIWPPYGRWQHRSACMFRTRTHPRGGHRKQQILVIRNRRNRRPDADFCLGSVSSTEPE